MITADAYSASVGGLPLAVRSDGSSVTFDATAAPHVSAEITISRPVSATLAALDPRLSPRVTVTAGNGIPRTFDLGVRRRRAGMLPGTILLELASDEAILDDYAPLADDRGAFTFQSSLRGVVNYALGKAIPGAALQAAPSTDANVTTYGSATNVATNPRGSVNTTGWGATGAPTISRLTGDPVYGTAIQALYGAASGSAVRLEHSGIPVTPGKTYDASMSVRSSMTIPSGAYIGVALFNAAGVQVGGSSQVAMPISGSYARRTATFTAPADAAQAIFRIVVPSVTAGATLIASAVMFRESSPDPGDTGYWDGDTADTAVYRYDWTNTAGASSSTRTALVDRPPDSLVWRAGVTALAFLQPILQAQGLRLVCDEQRRWTLRNETYNAAGALALRDGVNIIEGDEEISRDAGYWFDARVTRYRWTDTAGLQQERIDAYALTTPYTRLSTLEVNAPYPGPGRSEYAVRRAQGLGREITVTAPADWTANAEQPISVTLADTPVQIGLTQTVRFDIATGRMTITTRTTDTPAGAINLLPGTINALPGTINSLT